MKVDTEKEHVYYEDYDPVALEQIMDTQHKVIDFQKKNKQKDLFSILIVVDGVSLLYACSFISSSLLNIKLSHS